jgi:histidinol-phosphate aminotransferase
MPGYSAPPQEGVRVKLNQNENPYDMPAEWKNRVLRAAAELDWTRYPVYDPPDLRAKIAARFGVGAGAVLLGNGSNQLLYLLGSAFVSPGDRVVVAPPTFSLFALVARLAHGEVVPVDQNRDFSLDEDRLLAEARSAKLTFLCSPNNPTGRPVPIAFLERLLGAAGGIVVWDEAYGEFGGETAVPLLDGHPNLIVLKTFSKAMGLAGLRIGYLLARPEIVTELRKVNIPYNVNPVSQAAAMTLLDHPEWVERQVGVIRGERGRLTEAVRSIPRASAFPSAANFVLIRVPDSRAAFNALKSAGVLVRPVEPHPLLEHCLRVTVGTPAENDAFLAALREAVC